MTHLCQGDETFKVDCSSRGMYKRFHTTYSPTIREFLTPVSSELNRVRYLLSQSGDRKSTLLSASSAARASWMAQDSTGDVSFKR